MAVRRTRVCPPKSGFHSAKSELVRIAWRSLSGCSTITSTEAAGVADRSIQHPIFEGVHVMKSFTLVATALVLSGSIFSVAKAAPPSDAPTVVVKFGDLD